MRASIIDQKQAQPNFPVLIQFEPDLSARSEELGLTDILPRLNSIFLTLRAGNVSIPDVQAKQRETQRAGRLLMPSPFAQREDQSTVSYYSSHRAFFQFGVEETYFWVTAMLAQAHVLGVLFLPSRGVAISLYPFAIDDYVIRTFVSLWQESGKMGNDGPPLLQDPVVPVGHTHLMHVLWNELPALEAAIDRGRGATMRVVSLHRPFGPMARLFPELATEPTLVTYADLPAFNRENRFIVPLGSLTITASVQARVRRVADELVTSESIIVRQEFAAKFNPIFWVSVKPPNRTLADQPTMLAAIMAALRGRYANAGFLINGVSHPWDYPANPNYPPWFQEAAKRSVQQVRLILGELLLEASPELRAAIQIVSDVPVVEEIAWGEICDFYFCHGGTMQNKIGWVHRKPGMIHSNTRFIESYQRMRDPVEDMPPPSFVPAELVIDDPESDYDAHQLARKDQNYRFVSADDVARELMAAFESARPPTRLARGNGL